MVHTGGIEEMIEIVPDRDKRPETLEEYIERMSEEEKEKFIKYLKEKEKTDE